MDSPTKTSFDPYRMDVFEFLHHLDDELEKLKKEEDCTTAGEVALLKYNLRLRDILHKRLGLATGGDHVLAR